ncbi:Stp1/IreP family PP2C-type Ser/Thr phosphatase [Ottowia sp. GY511]|uniref:Stp1/IreP family PP2C-type Ser/Thr phosphatase n=1 Tax=Ottowia flava TaxID=2675430 RepID=A0ABW4KYH2_9BURK|nr:Stp1/IreP family PP2C-type Ser/Thr phosphatase [Ottowia sp. GY511]TXK27081.1 Stp1/IreP family PP2C-type Ser/Thr phosphatase [Ottowia sp. GY511]
MDYEYSSLSDVGRQRANNEDAVLIDAEHGIVVLADGMGGYNAGEVASALAVDLIVRELRQWLSVSGHRASARDVRRAMEICVDLANRQIFEAAHTHAAYAGMGTTLVMAVLRGDTLLVGHVGDSRLYRWREGTLEQVTRDHSLLQEQLDIGLITPEEAEHSGNRNLVTRALGVEDTVLLDVRELTVVPGDTLLLCSDGLNDMLSDAEIADIVGAGLTLDACATRLVGEANERGGRDNVSVALIRAHETPKKSGVIAKLLRK